MADQEHKGPQDSHGIPPAGHPHAPGAPAPTGAHPGSPAPDPRSWPQAGPYPGYPYPGYPYPGVPGYGYPYPAPAPHPAFPQPAPPAVDARESAGEPAPLPQPRPGIDYCIVGGLLRKLDDKSRFLLPKQYSQHVAGTRDESYIISLGPDGSMIMEPQVQWWRRFHRQCQEADDQEKRLNVRLQSYRSFPVQPDAQNRILLPKELKDLFGITDTILLIGLSDRAEIWNPETFEQLLAENRAPRMDYLSKFYG